MHLPLLVISVWRRWRLHLELGGGGNAGITGLYLPKVIGLRLLLSLGRYLPRQLGWMGAGLLLDWSTLAFVIPPFLLLPRDLDLLFLCASGTQAK